MAYDEELASRIWKLVADNPGITDKKMFGGLCYLDRGNMCFGIVGDGLMVRVGPDAYQEALAQPHASVMDFTGRPMKGMVYVEASSLEEKELQKWLQRALAFTEQLPTKVKRKKTG